MRLSAAGGTNPNHGSFFSRRRVLLALGGLLLAVPTGVRRVQSPVGDQDMSAAHLAHDIKSITNIFEVGGPDPDYAYVEALGDGRGYTITQYGLCTNELEVGAVIRRLLLRRPQSPLGRFLGALPPHGGGTDMHLLEGFSGLWQEEIASEHELSEICDEIADGLYFNPAMAEAGALAIDLPVGRSIFYDTYLQHGGGDDPDSFGAIRDRAVAAASPSDQTRFLSAFLDIRRQVLMDPVNLETTEVWRQSIGRVDALRRLLETNPQLKRPITILHGSDPILLS